MSGADWLQEAVRAAPGCDAAAVAWRHRGKVHLTVIAKATFSFAADGPMAHADPRRVAWVDQLNGQGPIQSVRFPSDVAPLVPGVQVIVAGHAYSAGRPATSLLVRLGVFVGSHALLHKEVRVQDSAPFSRMPLVYERAFGGIGCDENPLGQGADGEPASLNIVHPTDPSRPAGLGAVGPSWPRRRRRLGDARRRALEAPIAEIPDAFDWAYFLAAPDDQRIGELRGDEWIVMDGLTEGAPRLRTCLPRARGEARLFGLAAHGVPEGHALPLRADTLLLDTDSGTASVVWRNHLELPEEEALSRLTLTCGVETFDAPIAWPDPPTRAPRSMPVAEARPLTRDPEKTAYLESEKTAAFVPGSPPIAAPPPAIAAAAPTSTLAAPLPAIAAAAPTSTLAAPLPAIADPLPFLDPMGPSPMAFSRAPAEPREEVGTGTLAVDVAALPLSAPPFARPTPGAPTAERAPSKPAALPAEPAPGWTAEAEPTAPDKPSPAPPGKPEGAPSTAPSRPEPSTAAPAPDPTAPAAAAPEPAGPSPEEPAAAAPAPRPRPKARPRPPPKPRAPRPQIPGAPASLKVGLYGGFGS